MSEPVKNRILIIDDDPLVLKTFKVLLSREGFSVIPTSGYEEAMEAMRAHEFDLVLSDVRMPGRNGIETVADIQEGLVAAGKPDLPIIFITGYTEMSNELKAPFYGEILPKPIDNDRLLTTIRDYL